MAATCAEASLTKVDVFMSLADFEAALTDNEQETMSKYIVYRKDKDFGQKNVELSQHQKTYWDLKGVEYNGVPFHLVGTKVYGCHQGKDKCVRQKEQYHAGKEKKMLEDHVHIPRHRQVQNTKKLECPAQFTVRQIVRFPGFKIADDIKVNRREASASLKKAIGGNSSEVEAVVEYHTSFPCVTQHQYHPLVGEAAELREAIHPQVQQQIVKLTQAGVRKLGEMRRHLTKFINDELFRGDEPPTQTRRSFHPMDRDIRNLMARTKAATRGSKNDQVNLQTLTPRWLSQQDCRIKFRMSQVQEDGTESKLLFCYQTAWQQRLLNLYGQQMCLLDATYRTCRYAIPLFFLCVRTNVCYSVVGVFVTQSESTSDVKEAINVFKEWNPSWQPTHFMVDFSEVEIAALEEEFPDSSVLLCDFHREKAWVEWCRKKEHGVSGDNLLPLLRNVFKAATAEDFAIQLQNLQDSEQWKQNEKLRNWFGKKWVPEAKRWVRAFRDEELKVAITTNNGVERQNETLKHSYLQGYKNCTLSEMLTVVISDFLPNTYRKYIELNVIYSSSYRQYTSNIPQFLQNRPRWFVNHVTSRLTEAQQYNLDDVRQMGETTFHVKGQSRAHHAVDFAASGTTPSCTCEDWAKHKLPCKHLCAVFILIRGWGWDKLPSAYRDNPIFTLDSCFLGCTQDGEDCSSSSSSSTEISDDTTNAVEVDGEEPLCADLPPRKKQRKTKLRTQCASILREITDLTYHLQDLEYLEQLKDQLTDIKEDIRQHVPHDATLPLTLTPKKRKAETVLVGQPETLPVKRAPKRHPFTGRVGERAEVMKANFRVALNLQEDKEESNVSLCVEEVTVSLTDKDDETKVDCSRSDNGEKNPDTEGEVIGKIMLTENDKTILQTGQWLTDNHINCAQQLLKNEYPFIEGFHDTVILANNQVPVPASSECIQAHHVQNHWVLSTSVGGTITVYDSLRPSMKPSLRQQLVGLYRRYATGENCVIPVKVICTQTQRGSNDCGLFAVANAVALAEGISPMDVSFEQSRMRLHLQECFETQTMKMFPHQKAGGQTQHTVYQLSTFCTCHEHRPRSPMIQCDSCHQWFHYRCVHLSVHDVASMATEDKYICPACQA